MLLNRCSNVAKDVEVNSQLCLWVCVQLNVPTLVGKFIGIYEHDHLNGNSENS
jgi:hypothetical protein